MCFLLKQLLLQNENLLKLNVNLNLFYTRKVEELSHTNRPIRKNFKRKICYHFPKGSILGITTGICAGMAQLFITECN